jgi:phage FluMu gp28-like protein
VKQIAFKSIRDHLLRMQANNPELFDHVCGREGLLHTVVRFKNGFTILAESPVSETIRGHTAKVVYLMEANFIRDDKDLYTAVLFTLNTTNGYLIAESTPWNTDSIFHKMFNDDAYSMFSRHRIHYTVALHPNGPLTPEIVKMIETQLAGDPARWRREMLCEWTEDMNAWLPTSLITLTQDSSLDYLKATGQATGEFFL